MSSIATSRITTSFNVGHLKNGCNCARKCYTDRRVTLAISFFFPFLFFSASSRTRSSIFPFFFLFFINRLIFYHGNRFSRTLNEWNFRGWSMIFLGLGKPKKKYKRCFVIVTKLFNTSDDISNEM